MNRRLLLATVAVLALLTLAGCSMLFGGISDETLDREADYEELREQNATVVVDVENAGLISSGEYRAVFDLNGTDELSLSETEFFSDVAVDIHAVRYWYPNGTEVTGSELDIDQGRSSTDIRVPDGNGTLAFSGDAGRKSFSLPVHVEGSYVVYAPESHRTSAHLFGSVSPSGYDREVVDDRERLTWSDADSAISLRYYHTRDIPLFVGLVIVAVTIGGAGIAYYYRKVKRLERQRKELGLDVDLDDSDRKRPPPGMG